MRLETWTPQWREGGSRDTPFAISAILPRPRAACGQQPALPRIRYLSSEPDIERPGRCRSRPYLEGPIHIWALGIKVSPRVLAIADEVIG
jgi:hypothetical protein